MNVVSKSVMAVVQFAITKAQSLLSFSRCLVASFVLCLFTSGSVTSADLEPVADEPAIAVPTPSKSISINQSFGIALYQFQQGNYFDALVEISAAQLRYDTLLQKRPEAEAPAPTPAQTDIAEEKTNSVEAANQLAAMQAMNTLEAGIMLAYGMQNQAKDLISNVANQTLGGRQQDLAWFYLARLYAEKRDWQSAYTTIQNIGENLPQKLHTKLGRLKANIYINNGQIDEALFVLKHNEDPLLSAYTSFNLAVAANKNQNSDVAYSHLDQVTAIESPKLEVALLKDRANLAAAQIAASKQLYPKAYEHFNRVKIDSPYSGEALFGQGWAAFFNNNYDQALASWRMLQSNYALYPQAHKSRIAIPYAYLTMGKPGAALQKYREAVAEYELLMSQLSSAKQNISDGHIFEFMDKYRSGAVTDWHLGSVNFPVTLETTLIGSQLENQKIHKELTALAELYQLSYAVKLRSNDLTSFGYLIETSDQNHTNKTPLIKAQIEQLQQSKALLRAEQIRKQIANIKKNSSVYALMNSDERDYSERIERANKTLLLISNEDKKARYEARIKRVSGILLWNLSEDYVTRIWEAEKGLKSIDQSIVAFTEVEDRLQKIFKQHASKSGPYTDKIAQLTQDLEQTAATTDRLISQQELRIEQQFMIALNQKQEEIRKYLVHSHLAIARLTDDAKINTPKTEEPTDASELSGQEPTNAPNEAPIEASTETAQSRSLSGLQTLNSSNQQVASHE